jgi:hypothetical protein
MRKGPPLQSGPAPDVGPTDQGPYGPQRLSQAESLQSLTEEFVLFTPALLFTHADWDRDPVKDWAGEAPGRRVYSLDLPQAAFEGLEVGGDVNWCYRLLLCPRTQWADLYGFMGIIGFADRFRRRFHRALAQAIPVPDLLLLARLATLPDPVPTVQVVAFGVNGNRRQVAFVPAANPPLDRARPEVYPPEEETVRAANRFLSGPGPQQPPPYPWLPPRPLA